MGIEKVEKINLKEEVDKVRGGKSPYSFTPEQQKQFTRELSDDIQTQARKDEMARTVSYRRSQRH